MAKKTKEANASTTKKEAKAPVDPVKTRNLIDLLNLLALLLAIIAFSFQFSAVLTHRWKWQITALRPIIRPYDQQAQSTVYDDSRLDQRYGLFSRDVKLFSHHDEQIGVWGSTQFPRIDDGEENFHRCLSQTGTLRGALLTCSDRLESPTYCSCRRYYHWNAVIFFEIFALILLALLVIATVLLRTQFQTLLKLVGALLGALAFISMLLGLIILLSYLKRETRTLADIYPHTYHRFADKVGLIPDQRYPTVLRQVVRRQAQETYRAYALLPGQHPYNETHYQEFSVQDNRWVHRPYSAKGAVPYVPRTQNDYTTVRTTTTEAPRYNAYGPLVGYDRVYENTDAGIGWSTVFSIFSMIVALLVAAILAFSWLQGKKLAPATQTVTVTTSKTEYVNVPQEANTETIPLTQGGSNEQNARANNGDAVVIVEQSTVSHS